MSSNELMQLKYLLENVTCIVIKRLIGNEHHKVQFKVKLYVYFVCLLVPGLRFVHLNMTGGFEFRV